MGVGELAGGGSGVGVGVAVALDVGFDVRCRCRTLFFVPIVQDPILEVGFELRCPCPELAWEADATGQPEVTRIIRSINGEEKTEK